MSLRPASEDLARGSVDLADHKALAGPGAAEPHVTVKNQTLERHRQQ